jgi:hypothetical protein
MFALYTGVNFANPSGEADERDLRPGRIDRTITSDRAPSDISPCNVASHRASRTESGMAGQSGNRERRGK